jgi:formylglycine-generating enzyme required for sulfatase activity
MMFRRKVLFIFVLAGWVGCGKQNGTHSNGSVSSAGASGERSASGAPIETITSSGVQMVYLPEGEFMMGNDRGNPDEAPGHKVKLTGFLIDRFEVTQELFAKAQLPNPSHWNENPRKPVERVRWQDARQYCNERSLLEGLKPCYDETTWQCDFSANGYRLPTEAEWEYAARAGSEGPFDFGQADKLRQFSWFDENANTQTHVVGQKKPNRWGLHDMYGNVSEWCEDVYSATYYKDGAGADPTGPTNAGKDVQRVMRGGSWKASADMCRATFRQGQKTGDTDACFYTDYCGFRCVRRPSAEELAKMKGAN